MFDYVNEKHLKESNCLVFSMYTMKFQEIHISWSKTYMLDNRLNFLF